MNYFNDDQDNQQAQSSTASQNPQNQSDDADISADDVKSDMSKIFDSSDNKSDDPFADDHNTTQSEAKNDNQDVQQPAITEKNDIPKPNEDKPEFMQSIDPTPVDEPQEKLDVEELSYNNSDHEEKAQFTLPAEPKSDTKDPGIMADIEEKLLNKKSSLDKQKAELEEKIGKIEEMLGKINVIKDQAGEVIKFSEEL